MSVTLKQIIEGVRSYLGYPPYGRLPNHLILSRLADKTAYYLTALNMTNEGWFLIRHPLTITPNKSDFQFDVDGRPVLAVTVDDTDPMHVEREVEIVTVQDRDLYYVGPKQGMSSGAFPHVASSFTVFFDEDQGQRTIRVTPQHTQTAKYLIWLQPDTFAPPRLADNFPLMECFANLVKVDTALSLLPQAFTGENGDSIVLYERRLTADFGRYDAQFQAYKQISVNEQTGPRRGWASDSDGEYLGW